MGYEDNDHFYFGFRALTEQVVEKLEELNGELSVAETPEYDCPDKLEVYKFCLALLRTAESFHCFGTPFVRRVEKLKNVKVK